MSSIIICPECDRKLKVPETREGKTLRCPGCKSLIPAADEPEASAPPRAVRTAPRSAGERPRSRPPRDEEPEEEMELEEEEPIRAKRTRKKRPARRKSSTGLTIALVAGGVLLVLTVLGGGVGLIVYLVRNQTIPDAEWLPFTPPSNDCTVLMPGTPVPQTQMVNPDVQANQYIVERKNGNEAFGLVICDVPTRALRPSLLDEIATGYLKGVIDRLGGGQSSGNTPISLGNIPGLEIRIKLTARRGSVTGRTYLAKVGNGHRLYLLAVACESSEPNSKDAVHFLESFKLTVPASPPDFTAPLRDNAAQLPPAFNPPAPNRPPPNPGSRGPRRPRR